MSACQVFSSQSFPSFLASVINSVTIQAISSSKKTHTPIGKIKLKSRERHLFSSSSSVVEILEQVGGKILGRITFRSSTGQKEAILVVLVVLHPVDHSTDNNVASPNFGILFAVQNGDLVKQGVRENVIRRVE